MHGLLEVAKAAAVVKHSFLRATWQKGVGYSQVSGFVVLIIHQCPVFRKQWAGFLRRLSKMTHSLPKHEFLAVARQSCEHWSCSGKFSWSRTHIFPSFVETKWVNMQAEAPRSLYCVFLEGYNRVWPQSEDSLSSSSPFLGGRRSCCSWQQSSAVASWNAVVASGSTAWVRRCLCPVTVLLWTGPVRTDGTGHFPLLGRARQMLVGGKSMGRRSLEQNLGGCLLFAEEAGRHLPNTKWWGSKVSTLSFSFHKVLCSKISKGKNI